MSLLAAALALMAPLADLRVGEADGVVRLLLACAGPCEAEPSGDGGFLLRGVEDSLSIDLSDMGVTAVSIDPVPGGSRLLIETETKPRLVEVSGCGQWTLCFDLDLRPPEGSGEGPPTMSSVAAALSAMAAKGAPRVSDLRLELFNLTGLPLDETSCEEAAEALERDAWALDAYRHVALCRAGEGALSEADGLLARLLAYKPDPLTQAARAAIVKRMAPLSKDRSGAALR